LLAAPAGDYELTVSGSGFNTHTEDISLTENAAEIMIKDITVGAVATKQE